MSLLASDVKLPQDLSSIFSGIGTGTYNQIGKNYAKAGVTPTMDTSMGGPVGGTTDYQKQRLAATQGLDVGNLEARLGGELGNAGYQNTLGQRSYNQQSQLANIIGGAMAPSTLQQIFSGIGSVGSPLAMIYGMHGSGGPSLNPNMASTPYPISTMPTDPSGFENYGFPGYGGGF